MGMNEFKNAVIVIVKNHPDVFLEGAPIMSYFSVAPDNTIKGGYRLIPFDLTTLPSEIWGEIHEAYLVHLVGLSK
jgi:hypothetical protein